MNLYVTVLVCLLAGWMFQIGFAILQVQRYYKRINQLRLLGRCATGMGGSRYKGRVYAALVVNPTTREVIAAEKLAGVSVFAGFRPVPTLVGASLDSVLKDDLLTHEFSAKLRTAFRAAAQTLHDSFLKATPAPATEEGRGAATRNGGARAPAAGSSRHATARPTKAAIQPRSTL